MHIDCLILCFCPYRARRYCAWVNPGRCPGLGAGCPFRARQHWFKKNIHDFETILNTLPVRAKALKSNDRYVYQLNAFAPSRAVIVHGFVTILHIPPSAPAQNKKSPATTTYYIYMSLQDQPKNNLKLILLRMLVSLLSASCLFLVFMGFNIFRFPNLDLLFNPRSSFCKTRMQSVRWGNRDY